MGPALELSPPHGRLLHSDMVVSQDAIRLRGADVIKSTIVETLSRNLLEAIVGRNLKEQFDPFNYVMQYTVGVVVVTADEWRTALLNAYDTGRQAGRIESRASTPH